MGALTHIERLRPLQFTPGSDHRLVPDASRDQELIVLLERVDRLIQAEGEFADPALLLLREVRVGDLVRSVSLDPRVDLPADAVSPAITMPVSAR